MIEFKSNIRYKVQTPDGFQSFSGMRKTTKSEVVELELSNSKKIQASLDHKFIINSAECYAKDIKVGDKLTPTISATSVEIKTGDFILYDLTDVGLDHLYIADDIISHNCDFLTSGHSVIDGEIIKWYEDNVAKEPLERRGVDGDYWIWEYTDYTKPYIVSVDVARGDGSDDSCIQVFDVEGMTQVAEYIGKVSPRDLGKMAVAIATEYNTAMLVIENKNIGWDTVQEAIDMGYSNIYYSYRSDVYVDPVKHISKGYDLKSKKDKVPGFTTNTANRPMIISKLERYFAEKSLTVYSKRLLSQLYVFVWLNGKAQARAGRKDDAVMALGIGLFVRDTALKLQSIGIDMTKKALQHTHKKVYTTNHRSANDPWTMSDGKGNTISTKWLL